MTKQLTTINPATEHKLIAELPCEHDRGHWIVLTLSFRSRALRTAQYL
jgi:hypothetical protein